MNFIYNHQLYLYAYLEVQSLLSNFVSLPLAALALRVFCPTSRLKPSARLHSQSSWFRRAKLIGAVRCFYLWHSKAQNQESSCLTFFLNRATAWTKKAVSPNNSVSDSSGPWLSTSRWPRACRLSSVWKCRCCFWTSLCNGCHNAVRADQFNQEKTPSLSKGATTHSVDQSADFETQESRFGC